MISIHPNMKDPYSQTCFGALLLRQFAPTPEGLAAFSGYAARELQRVRNSHPDYDRKRFSAEDPIVSRYVKYYKRFKKTYHVLPQMESVLQGKELPDAHPLVQVLFLTEMQTGMLVAVHDPAPIVLPMSLEQAAGGEGYIGSGGRDVTVKARDILVRDQAGVLLSIIYGQDDRTRITASTRDALFFLNGVPGIPREAYHEAMARLIRNLQILQPGIQPEWMTVLEI